MPRPILLGKQRRITISEFYALCSIKDRSVPVAAGFAPGEVPQPEEDRAVHLQMIHPVEINVEEELQLQLTFYDQFLAAIGKVATAENQLESLSFSSSNSNCSMVIGTLTSLAFAIAQERIYTPSISREIAYKLMLIINALVQHSSDKIGHCVVGDDPLLFQVLQSMSILPNDNDNSSTFVPSILLPKCLSLTSIILTTHLLYSLTVSSSADLCISSLTVERLNVSAKHAFDSTWYDALRPHRSCIAVAGIMRLLLEGSKYATGDQDNKEHLAAAAVERIPTTHGTARDVISSCYKTLEMELNSADDPRGPVQVAEDVVILTAKSLCNVAQELTNLTKSRIGKACTMTVVQDSTTSTTTRSPSTIKDLATRYQEAVQDYQRTVEEEMTIGLSFVAQQRLKVQEEYEKKEVEKAARAAEFASQQTLTQPESKKKIEFEGMTEAQIAKILKKRAEKEAKVATKAKKKQLMDTLDVLTTLLGVGTVQVVKVLDGKNNAVRDEKVWKELEDIVERLQRGGVQRKPKIPKGTRDFLPEQVSCVPCIMMLKCVLFIDRWILRQPIVCVRALS